MLHRLLRIYPALWVAAGISALLLIMRGGPLDFDPVAFFLLPGPKPSFTWDILLWTLIYEMVFYVIIFALMLCRMTPSACASVLTGWAFGITAFFFYGPHVHHVYPGSYIVLMPLNLLFIAGAMTALYPSQWLTLLPRPILVLLAFSLWAASLGVSQENRLLMANLQAVSCVCALSAFAHAAFRWPKVIVRIGDASYGIYLLHFACIEMVATFLPMVWPGVPLSVGLPSAILIALTASGLFGLAEFSAYSAVSNWLRRRSRATTVALLKAVVDAIEAYEARRWPLGKDPAVPGGKG
jgi:peptidoglycan/LPS O-acetylase OafA/YrhL